MAISKRMRFEILRRDDHTCQYCGEKAPAVTLHVDHVKPKTLGGSDGPDNLVAACKECNSGKSSSSLDAPMVAAISERNLDWEIKAQVLSAQLRGTLERDQEYCSEFDEMWSNAADNSGIPAAWPFGYQGSVMRWSGMGYPIEAMDVAIETTFAASRVSPADKFQYLAGIIWRQIKEASVDLTSPAEPRLHTDGDMQNEWCRGYDIGVARGCTHGPH